MTIERTRETFADDAPTPCDSCTAGSHRGVASAARLSRRSVLHGAAGLGVLGVASLTLAACGGDDTTTTGTGGAGGSTTGSGGASTAPSTGAADAPAAEGIAATGDVPVGGGLVLDSPEAIVITQPSDGQYKAFSAVCTHQGCTVGGVTDNVIACPCHGSTFDAATGDVINGPATEALPAVAIAVSGDQITLA